MIKAQWKKFVECHTGVLNKLIHVLGFALVGLGILEKSLSLVLVGAFVQEFGHIYQYMKTHEGRFSPWQCFRPQLLFAYPLLILIILYVVYS
ncbi:hypothetical protein IPG41_05215 [Candidatus Peregrinibacteria bacterium]|nr:MAG: hypothetical protein IPG41_05215 [Candidatus Peregrinibacteria bacterium]